MTRWLINFVWLLRESLKMQWYKLNDRRYNDRSQTIPSPDFALFSFFFYLCRLNDYHFAIPLLPFTFTLIYEIHITKQSNPIEISKFKYRTQVTNVFFSFLYGNQRGHLKEDPILARTLFHVARRQSIFVLAAVPQYFRTYKCTGNVTHIYTELCACTRVHRK